MAGLGFAGAMLVFLIFFVLRYLFYRFLKMYIFNLPLGFLFDGGLVG